MPARVSAKSAEIQAFQGEFPRGEAERRGESGRGALSREGRPFAGGRRRHRPSSSVLMSDTNPLLDLGASGPRLPFDQIRAEHVRPAIDTLLAESRAAIRAISTARGETYDEVLGALERSTEKLSRAAGVVSHLESVATTPALREAETEVKPLLSAFYSSIALDPDLWQALKHYASTPDAKALTGARKRHLEKTLDEFRRSGADLDAAGKARLTAVDVELSQLTMKFGQNVLDATNAFELIVDDEARLAGLPESAVSAARASAASKGHAEGYRFTLHAPSVIPVLTYLDDASIRETIWRAFNARATAAPFDNAPLIRRILELRRERATILGKTDFADLVLEDRMAKTGSAAARFVRELEAPTRASFEREKTELAAFRRELEGPAAKPIAPWDVAYYAEKLRTQRFDFDEEALRPYFSAERVLDGLFAIASRLYGVSFAKVDAPSWDESVRVFTIRDGDATLGLFHVDLHPRENKRGGAWMNGLVMGGPSIEVDRFDPHVGLFCANATPPIDGEKALLTHDEVETLFHEFGHLLHQLLSNVDVRSLAGTNVAWDFVELPSQIMENWTWERTALDLFARHVETGETIPVELFARKHAARTFRAATMQMRQLGFAALDLALHRDYDPSKDGDVLTYARRVMAPYAVTPLPDDYAMVSSFTHLFGSSVGYAAGYYSYKWAEVLDADAFSRFRDGGVLSPEVGRAFRELLLSRGDAEDPMKLFVDFVGRPPKVDALLERNGLAAPAPAAH
jgi:oligopeptidase A